MAEPDVDIGAYCRSVEDELTRVNGGHLVRIVGPGFELVRQWALDGVPLSVVVRGIEMKADRHRAGASTRPLRLEFCASDVRAVFDAWRRAVGVTTAGGGEAEAATASPKRKSLSKIVERAIDRLSHVLGRLDWPEGLRATASATIDELAGVAEDAKGARGAARDALEARLADIDARMIAGVRQAAPADVIAALEIEAGRDLAPFRARLAADAWRQAIDVTIARLLRAHFGLPALET